MINKLSTYTAIYDKEVLGNSSVIKNSYFKFYIKEVTGHRHNIDLIKKQGFVPRNDMCILLPIVEIFPETAALFSNLKYALDLIEINNITMSDTYHVLYLPGSCIDNHKLVICINEISIYFDVPEEIERHLLNTQTITVIIHYNNRMYSRTVVFNQDDTHGIFAISNGAINSNLDKKIKYGKEWEYATLAPSYQKDFIPDTSEYNAYGYSTNPNEPGDVPHKFSYRGPCIACGISPTQKMKLTREHCTPKWLCNASASNVQPVVANILCKDCNAYFGGCYEMIVKEKYMSLSTEEFMKWIINDKYNTFSRWALKTSYTLAQASNKWVNPAWIQELRKGNVPAGFSVYTFPFEVNYNRYFYITSTFDERHGDIFLLTFISGKIIFLVTNYSGHLNIPFYRVFPDFMNPSCRRMPIIDISALHSNIMQQITGQEYLDERLFYADDISN